MGIRIDSVYYIKKEVSILRSMYGSLTDVNKCKSFGICNRVTDFNGNNIQSRCLNNRSSLKVEEL